ncbi:unnamed protein product [Haemonchus placei]|uniref:Uncharacterized protein n=1 Tax=Haemonchus placei TaxID=6290 RepID=A0A3P7Z2J9_HAEPC|nr:unnamed protein product [Haemonchus placei]
MDLNEEFLVSVSHQLALITSLPFVHTARRYYRLNGLVNPSDWLFFSGNRIKLLKSWANLIYERLTSAKAFAKDVFINQERKLGDRRRSDTVVVLTINYAD